MQPLLGHSRAIQLFQSALISGRLHHAWIFHGPQGVGKFTAAVMLAQLMLCHDPQSDLAGQLTPCGQCASCRLFAAQPSPDADDEAPLGTAHPDFHVITKELARFSNDATVRNRKLMNIPVEVLRTELLEPVYRAAQLGHRKVFIVDEAELLGPAGQNALLKTLEEPPANTHIILVTSSEDKLLPTVRSRCQRLAFGPVPDELIKPWLLEHMPELDPGDQEWVLSFADGSLGRILLAKRYNLFAWYRVVLPAVDQTVAGRVAADLGAQMTSLMDDLAKTWVDAHANASKEAANKMAAGLMFTLIAQHARREMAYLASLQSPDDLQAAETALSPWLNVIDALAQAQRALASNVNMSLVMDYLVAMMARPGMVHALDN